MGMFIRHKFRSSRFFILRTEDISGRLPEEKWRLLVHHAWPKAALRRGRGPEARDEAHRLRSDHWVMVYLRKLPRSKSVLWSTCTDYQTSGSFATRFWESF